MTGIRDRAAVAGIGQTEFSKDIGRSEFRIALEAIKAALDDAGLSPRDVDGMVKFSLEKTMEVDLAASLGIRDLSFFGDIASGGGAGCGAVGHAAMAIATGMASVVVVWRSRNRGSGGRPWQAKSNRVGGEMQWFLPWGLSRPVDQIAMLTRRHMIEYGTTSEHLGAVATTFRSHAERNPAAMMRSPMSMEDYLAARWISEPLRLFDCCLESDGALALVLCSPERARHLSQPPVLVRGAAQGMGPEHVVMANYFTASPLVDGPSKYTAQTLWRVTGMGPDEIDCAQIYDAFSPLVLMSLEDYGFCKPGDAGAFVAEGNLRLGGALPSNTSGGSLSEAYVHGMNLIVEGVRQIRGTSTSQVAGCETVWVTSGAGVPTSSLVLRKP